MPINRILGGCGLGLEYNLPNVKVALFHERDLKDNTDSSEGVCKICNGNERRFVINRGSGACTALFNSIQLTNVRRPDRGKNEELVTEHKYAFVFKTDVQALGIPIPLKVHMSDYFMINLIASHSSTVFQVLHTLYFFLNVVNVMPEIDG
jgi:STAT protein, DNA binding domain